MCPTKMVSRSWAHVRMHEECTTVHYSLLSVLLGLGKLSRALGDVLGPYFSLQVPCRTDEKIHFIHLI
jgi:hypothetical protein